MKAHRNLYLVHPKLALLFYSLGVWAERITKYLKYWHAIFFWIGFVFDVSGTLAMHKLADGPFDIFEPHTLTGQIALWLMFIHAIWATIVLIKNDERWIYKFHKFSVFVWVVWLIPYFSPMFFALQ